MSDALDVVEKPADGTGSGIARFYVNLIKTKKGGDRAKVARELHRYLNGEFRDESSEFQQEFVAFMDAKADHHGYSAIYECINSTDQEERKAGTMLIVLLTETTMTSDLNRVVRFAHYLLKVLLLLDEAGMEMAARGLAFLIQTSKAYAAELVEKCLDQSLEWTEEDAKHNERRLAAAILLRELALFTSTAFFLRANQFFRNIFRVMRDPKAQIRLAAANALHASLTVTSQREAKEKSEWYKKCYDEALSCVSSTGEGLKKEERIHCFLLILNELLRIADASTERARLAFSGVTSERESSSSLNNAVDFITVERFQTTVESRTAKTLVAENFKEIYEKVMEARHCREAFVLTTLLEVLPRMNVWMKNEEATRCVEVLLPLLPRSSHAQLAAALFIMQRSELLSKFIPDIFNFISDAITTKDKKKNTSLQETNIFVLLSAIVRAYGNDVVQRIESLLPHLLGTGLSKGVVEVLHEVHSKMESVRVAVLDGLLEQVALILIGTKLPSKIAAPHRPIVPSVMPVNDVKKLVLAMETLGQFEFQRHSLQMFMSHVAEGYAYSEHVDVRLAAVQCCVCIAKPFMKVYESVRREQKPFVLNLIHYIMNALVTIAVTDSDVIVRLRVLSELSNADRKMLSHIAQPELLELLLMCLRDEKLEMQEATVCLLGKIGMINPALVLPRLRRTLLETIGQLMNSGEGRLETHSARIIAQMSNQNPKFMRPYMGALLQALQPKLRYEQRHADVTVSVLHSLSELAIVGGSEVVKAIDSLFPKLIQFATDSSSLKRREAALKAIGNLCASTAYVVDAYKDYPKLLETMLTLVRTEMSQSMRRQTMRVLGILGALDPYTHKVFTGAVHSATSAVSTALSLPISRKVVDPRQDIVQWFNYERCTLEEFYPSITIANLLHMLEDDAYSQLFAEITQGLLTIFRSLGAQFPQFVHQVIPQLMSVTEKCRPDYRDFFIRQLGALLATIEQHCKPFLHDIFALLARAWREESSLHVTVIGVLETIGSSLGTAFTPFMAEVMPYILEAFRTDRAPERKLASTALSCIRALCMCLSGQLHLVLPPLFALVDDPSVALSARLSALATVQQLASSEDLSDYSSRLILSWTRAVAIPQLQTSSIALLNLIIAQNWKHFAVFSRTIETNLAIHGLKSSEFIRFQKQNGRMMSGSKSPVDETRMLRPVTGPSYVANKPLHTIHNIPKMQKLNVDLLRRAWTVVSLVSKEDWSQWLVKLRLAFMRSGSSAAIRAVASLADQHHQLAKDLFTAAFMSVWTELNESEQNHLTDNLLKALESSQHPDVIQTILNLAEFMDHSEKGPLPIHYAKLGKSAEGVKAYAKALRYKELEINKHKGGFIGLDDAHSLITFANKLNVQEEAAGVIESVEKGREKEGISVLMRSRWYEKLNDWEKALELLQSLQPKTDETSRKERQADEHEMRCLEALGRWRELHEHAKNLPKVKAEQKMTVIAARAAWACSDWMRMQELTEEINENSQDGSFLRAVLAVKKDNFDDAVKFIEKCRDMHDAELSAMAAESYERAYPAMVLVQQLSELEEAIEYKLRPERRARIALLWSRRLQGCRQNVEQWQKLLLLRSVVLSPAEMHPLRVKFSSLCRKQGKHSMCRSELRSLLGLPPQAELHSATPPLDRPQLVLALCKQLWMDDMKRAAVATLDGLGRHLDRLPITSHTHEARRLVAKTFLKLGEWTEAQEQMAMAVTTAPPSGRHGSFGLSAAIHSAAEAARAGCLSPRVLLAGGESGQVTKIIRYYSKATEYDPTWHKAWHRLATAYFSALSVEKERRLAGLAGLPGNGSPSPSSPLPQLAAQPPNNHNISFIMPHLPHQKASLTVEYAAEAVKAFARALQLAQGSRLEDTLRYLAVWFDHGDRDEVYNELRDSLKSLPIEMWLEVVPQLMARLDSSSRAAVLIQNLVLEVAKQYPQSMVYALTVATKSPNEMRAKNAREILSLLEDAHRALVEQASTVSEELVRCAILWHEQWHEALDEGSRLYFQEKNIKAMLEVLEPMHRMMETGATTMKENSFFQTYCHELQDARKFCLAFQRTTNGKELTQAWEIYYQVFKRIASQLRQMTSLDLSYISPVLQKSHNLELAVPGTFDPNSPLVTIMSFGSHLQVITSKQRPRKMTIRGSDGMEYAFLLKGHEDPRQDERVMQLFGLVNTLLVHNADTCRRNLTIQRYSIIALSQNSGLIGWVPHCDTLHSLVRDYREKKKVSLSMEHKVMQTMVTEMDQLTLMQKIQLFQKALTASNGDDLQQILWLKSPNSEAWFERRTNYTRSMACMSMVGYILGLGDRHPSNLMLDRLTGKIVHIDFGDCFEVAMTREKFPEKIPFRLTRMLIKAMEITGIEGNYRLTCERVLNVLRQNRQSLLAVLEAFVYDPLINWRLLDVNKRNPGEKKDFSKVNVMDVPEAVSRDAIDRIKLKLTGRDPMCGGSLEAADVREHVSLLIEHATLHDNLALCYIGWCPFW